jgi:hypothetical protein
MKTRDGDENTANFLLSIPYHQDSLAAGRGGGGCNWLVAGRVAHKDVVRRDRVVLSARCRALQGLLSKELDSTAPPAMAIAAREEGARTHARRRHATPTNPPSRAEVDVEVEEPLPLRIPAAEDFAMQVGEQNGREMAPHRVFGVMAKRKERVSISMTGIPCLARPDACATKKWLETTFIFAKGWASSFSMSWLCSHHPARANATVFPRAGFFLSTSFTPYSAQSRVELWALFSPIFFSRDHQKPFSGQPSPVWW